MHTKRGKGARNRGACVDLRIKSENLGWRDCKPRVALTRFLLFKEQARLSVPQMNFISHEQIARYVCAVILVIERAHYIGFRALLMAELFRAPPA